MPWIKSCDIQPHILGSDHCPVVAEFHDSIVDDDGKTLLLWEHINPPGRVNASDAPLPDPPKLAARYFSDFGSEQRSLKNFFGKNATQTKDNSQAVAKQETAESLTAEPAATSASASVGDAAAAAVRLSTATPRTVESNTVTNDHLDLTGDVTDEEKPATNGSSQNPGPAPSAGPSGSNGTAPKFVSKKTKKGQQNLSSFFKPSSPMPSTSKAKAEEKPSKKRKKMEQDADAPRTASKNTQTLSSQSNGSQKAENTGDQPELIDVDDIASVASEEDIDADLAALRDKAKNGARVRQKGKERSESIPPDGQDEVDMRDVPLHCCLLKLCADVVHGRQWHLRLATSRLLQRGLRYFQLEYLHCVRCMASLASNGPSTNARSSPAFPAQS